MTECVAGDMLFDVGQRRRFFDGALKDGFVQMVATPNSGFGIQIVPMRGKYPLPSPSAVCIRVLSAKRFGQSNVAASFLQILFKMGSNIFDVKFETGFDGGGKNSDAILVPFPLSHCYLAVPEVDVLDAQRQAFEETETGAVHQHGGDEVRPGQPIENCGHLVPCEDNRKELRSLRAHHAVEPVELDAEHVPVQEQEGAERLGLGRLSPPGSGNPRHRPRRCPRRSWPLASPTHPLPSSGIP